MQLRRWVRTAAALWTSYASTEDALAWKDALTLLRELQPLFEAAVVHDPSVATAYPALTRIFEVPKVIAKTATATKRKKARVKAQTAATASTAAAHASGTTTG